MRPSSLALPIRVAIAVMTLFTLVVGLSTNASSASVYGRHGNAPDPTVTGPILPSNGIAPSPPLSSSAFLSQVGYEESEYFISGTATSYLPTDYASCEPSCTAGPLNGQWSVMPYSTAPYTTRVVVYRPIDPRKFSGTVMVEWLNNALGIDIPAVWGATNSELIRDGVAWVGVSAQAAGVNWLTTNDPARYGSLSHPGDSFSYDIFSQAGQAVWDNSAQLLGGLTPRHVIATGESESANRLFTYIDAVAPLVNVYNGYLVDSRNGAAPLSQSPEPTVTPTFFGTILRTDISAPVFEFETEADVASDLLYDRQPNTNQFRLWEVAGTSHADYYGTFVGPTVTGNEGAILNLVAMQNPPSTIPGFGTCPYPINTGGAHWILNAAASWINQWVANGQAPPIPPLLQTTTPPGEYPVVFATDANGNVLGGVRSPQVDAPIATLSGVQGVILTTCYLFGSTIPFSPGKIATLYPTHAQFVADWDRAVLKDVLGGYLLPPDALELDNSALVSDIG
jgi:hypothetical protein